MRSVTRNLLFPTRDVYKELVNVEGVLTNNISLSDGFSGAYLIRKVEFGPIAAKTLHVLVYPQPQSASEGLFLCKL